jgi:hypothetical protein
MGVAALTRILQRSQRFQYYCSPGPKAKEAFEGHFCIADVTLDETNNLSVNKIQSPSKRGLRVWRRYGKSEGMGSYR